MTWPVVIAVGLWTVRGTLQRDSQDVKREHRWISAGFVGQTLATLGGFSLLRIATALNENRSPVPQLGTPVAITVLLVFVVAIPNVHRYEQQYDDVRRYSMAGLLLVFGAVSALGSRLISPQYRFGVLALSVVALVSGVLLGAVRYYRL